MKALSNEQEKPEVSDIPAINENKLAPRGSFILPRSFVQGLMATHLDGLESRLIKEVNRLEVWVSNLETQLEAAYNEVERLTKEKEESNRATKPPR